MTMKKKPANRRAAGKQNDAAADAVIKKALTLFAEGKDRNETAKRLGYKNHRSLDMYFRRRNYRWDAVQGTYTVHETPKLPDEPGQEILTTKAQQIVALLSMEGKDPRQVAKLTGFSDIQQMADYMKGRGYVWDGESGNYVRDVGIVEVLPVEADACELIETEAYVVAESDNISAVPAEFNNTDLSQYIGMLTFLQKHKEKLYDLLMVKHEKKIPRYVIAGACMAKSLQIPVSLDKLVKNFSVEKNVSQKDVLTVALIEFLTKYGYDVEVEYMINVGRV
jgi:hypothetical protein